MLDDLKIYEKYDPGDVHSLLFDFHAQFSTGRKIAETSDYDKIAASDVRQIVVAGMGGSAIGADLLRCYSLYEMKIPMIVNRDYLIPGFVDKHTLVVLSSYSGNTEEMLMALEAARFLGAQLFAITSDGKLSDFARDLNFGLIEIPGGLPPRAALGYSFVPLTKLCEFWGFIPPQDEFLENTQYALHKGAEKLSRDVPTEENAAKKMALKLHGKLPIIYSSPRLEAVATRFRGQIEENGKALAYSSVVPEMNHNELVGWKHLYDFAEYLQPIFLVDFEDHPRNVFRMNFVADVMRELGVEPIFIEPPQKDAPFMTRMFEIIQLGDFTSYYLAILNEEDPKPVRIIDKLKASLSQFEG
ncbi:bifunctional phosphoglucose/phosphomannose isomerase [bacterium]|nr:bifunctional phosphoglucose/phosphomannose isomerase [bacterium]